MSLETDVAVIGGGLGGVAAALALADAGTAVVLVEETSRIGGQVTTQAVAALDEHPLVERAGRTARYAEFRERVRDWYRRERGAPARMPDGAPLNPGNGWVSRLCFEPVVGDHVLQTMLASHEAADRLRVLTGTRIVTVRREGSRIVSAELDRGGERSQLRAGTWLDATDLGDLLALAEAPWVTGAEARDDTGEPNAPDRADPRRVQAATVCVALERRSTAVSSPAGPPPEGYAALRDTQPFTLTLPGHDGADPTRFRMDTTGPSGSLPFWTYRRLRDGALVRDGEEGAATDVALINWPGNDYRERPLFGRPPGPDPAAVRAARRLSVAFVHWLRTEAPRDDGGHGYPELQPCSAATGTPDGLAEAPYVREGRRLRALHRVVEQDLLPGSGRARARAATPTASGSAGTRWTSTAASATPPGRPSDRYDPTLPFQIPAAALVAEKPVNLIAAGKCLGTTHLTNGAYRVHPVEWAIGEAAGALAHRCRLEGRDARDLATDLDAVRRVQRDLLAQGAPIHWFADLDEPHPAWASAQLLAVAGGLDGDAGRGAELDARP